MAAFGGELLIAWCRRWGRPARAGAPGSLAGVLGGPLFLNKLIVSQEKPLIYADWIAAGLTRVTDIGYEAVPGLLPAAAIHETCCQKGTPALYRELYES